ncbi:MAG: alpha/beta fold hydrolase [Lachnospiraceae bacterium]|nr:alpha/beta fold hydrolase [Lachnospiraceae bacterium]
MKKNGKKIAALATLASLAVGTTVAIHIVNTLIDKKADTGLLDKENTFTYNWRLSPVTYKKYGTGSPILLLHELSACSSSYEWNRVIEPMAKDHTVYVLDLPGCGLSEKPNVTYTNFFFVELITDFMKNMIQEPCDVIATGISASLAITSCNCDRSLFRKLILVNPASPQQLGQIPGKRSRFRKGLLAVPIFGTMLYHMLISRKMLTKEFTQRLFFDAAKVTPEQIETYYESGHRDGSKGRFLMSSITGHYVYFHVAHALQSIDNDIVIVGGDKQEYIQDTIQSYQRMNPAIESVLVEDTKHLPQLESPDEFLKQISVYIND